MPHTSLIPIGGCGKNTLCYYSAYLIAGRRDPSAPLGVHIKAGRLLVQRPRAIPPDDHKTLTALEQSLLQRAGLDPAQWSVLKMDLERLTLADYRRLKQRAPGKCRTGLGPHRNVTLLNL